MRADWGRWGSQEGHDRYISASPKLRRPCWMCRRMNVRKRATHLGCCNGVAMTFGCEWHMRKWAAKR